MNPQIVEHPKHFEHEIWKKLLSIIIIIIDIYLLFKVSLDPTVMPKSQRTHHVLYSIAKMLHPSLRFAHFDCQF